MLSKVSQRNTNNILFQLCVESKKQMNKHSKAKPDSQIQENEQVVARGETWEGTKQERGPNTNLRR